MLNFLYIDKTIFKRYAQTVVIGLLIVGIIGFFWYNNIVSEEDKITFFTAILISNILSLVILLTLTFRKQAFLLYLLLFYLILFNLFFIDIYSKMKINMLGSTKLALITDKEIETHTSKEGINTNFFYINYNYNYSGNTYKNSEIVNRDFYIKHNIGDEINIKYYDKKSTIKGNIPYHYYFIISVCTYLLIYISYIYIKEGTWLGVYKPKKKVTEAEKEERRKRGWEFID